MMLGNGEIFYHFTYIDDLVDGIVLCGTKDAAVGQTYIVLGAKYFTLNEVVAMIAHELKVGVPGLRLPLWPFYLSGALCEAACKPIGIEPPIYRRQVDFFSKSRAFDTSKARTELGFNPKTDLPDGIRMTTDWYQKRDLI
jgi:nucleoside-diphosphate-sugar epimerase